MSSNCVLLVIGFFAVTLRVDAALNCYVCSGDQCVDSASRGNSELCNGVEEQCFTMFNGYVPIRRGCWSQLTDDEKLQCSGSNCSICTTDHCNVFSREDHTCVVCSSVISEDCVSNPEKLSPQRCEAASLDVADTQCYSRVIGSVTERNCIESQEDLDACDGSQCETCADAGCNNVEFPTGRQKCASCVGELCNSTIYCSLPDDNCVIIRTSGTVSKSCESALDNSVLQACQSNQTQCTFCGKQECNIGVVNFGAKRECYTCEGTACLRSSLEIETCHNADDECFSLFEGFNPTRRGCKSALTRQEKATCDDPDNVSCDLCDTDVCNLSSRQDHNCFYCSSVVDNSCITNPQEIVQCPAPDTEISDEAQCYTRIIGGVTERGCLGSALDALDCRSPENCEMCTIEDGQPCNRNIFPVNRTRCMVGNVSNQYCPNPEDSCAQISANGTIIKKCQSTMSAVEVAFCGANSNKCYFCNSDNCNEENQSFDYIECLGCSSDDNLNCAVNPLEIETVNICDSCVTILANNTGTQPVIRRDCLDMLPPEEYEQCTSLNITDPGITCKTCNTNRCNEIMYPADWLSCYTCDGELCFSHDSITVEYCPYYRKGDSCVTQRSTNGTLIGMGCKSMLSAFEAQDCDAHPAICKTCNSSRCNDPTEYLGSGNCVQCNSSLDANCIGRAGNLEAEPCNDPLNNKCYTRIFSGFTVRGCLSDLDDTAKSLCQQGQNCITCNSTKENCNVDIYPPNRLTCYTCLHPPCRSSSSVSIQYCPKYLSDDSCITQMDSSGQLIRMGCKSTLSSSELSICSGNSQLCQSCTSPGCNNPAQLPSGIKCHQCNSTQDTACKNVQSGTAAYCQPFNSANKCYTIVQQNGDTVRRCSTLERNAQCAGAKLCEICLFDGCNSKNSSAIAAANVTQPIVVPPHCSSEMVLANVLPIITALTIVVLTVNY